MGVPGLRSVAFCSSVVAQENTVHQGSLAYVPADLVGIVKEFRFLGRVCGPL